MSVFLCTCILIYCTRVEINLCVQLSLSNIMVAPYCTSYCMKHSLLILIISWCLCLSFWLSGTTGQPFLLNLALCTEYPASRLSCLLFSEAWWKESLPDCYFLLELCPWHTCMSTLVTLHFLGSLSCENLANPCKHKITAPNIWQFVNSKFTHGNSAEENN